MGHSIYYQPAMLSDGEAEALRQKLVSVLPRLERKHLMEMADMLYEAARERRRPESARTFETVV
jgi:hypothetical protein